MNYFIDTNIFLRYFTDEEFSKIFNDCSNLINNIKLGKIHAVTSHLVLAEIAWTLATLYGSSKSQVLKALKAIGTLNNLKLINSFNTEVANRLYTDYPIKYIDALIASNPDIQSKKMVVISYDKDFDKLRIIRKEPSQIV